MDQLPSGCALSVPESSSIVDRLFHTNRLPVVLQSEAAECGLACLAMVSAYFGKRISLAELRRRFSASLNGTTLKALMSMADGLGLSARPLRLELSELAQLRCPAILHWDLKHFVVLKRVTRRGLWIHDPTRGLRQVSLAAADRHFSGVALELSPAPTFEKQARIDRVRLSDFYAGAHGLLPSIVQILVLATVLQIFTIFSPILNQFVVDSAITRGDGELLTVIGIGMLVLLVVSTAGNLLKSVISLHVGTQLSIAMHSNLLRHTLRLGVAWFEKRHVGDILSRFDSLGPVQNVLTSAVVNIVLNTAVILTTTVMMFIYAPVLGFLEIGLVLLSLLIRAVSFPYLRAKMDEGIHLSAKAQTTFLETIRGARIFKLFGGERERLMTWQNEQVDAMNNSVQVARFGLWGGAGMSIVNGIQSVMVWYLGASMVIKGQMTLGMLFAFQAYAGQFSASAFGLVGQWFTFKTLDLHLERLADIVYADVERGFDSPAQRQPPRGEIELRAVTFSYAEHERTVLQNANCTIREGEMACFVGPSGQGKTTIMKLLVGFHDPNGGEVLIDGVPLRKFGTAHYRSHIGAVMQDDQLFSGTIADNIAFFDPDMRMDRVEEAATLARVHDEIAQMPMGYNSLVGDMGSTLSGGQRQRVFLARALYRKPRILFLDEGTANLDKENEARIMESLAAMKITRVVIAHREAALAGADRVFSVKAGSIEEIGLSDGDPSGDRRAKLTA